MEKHLKYLGYELIETITYKLPDWLPGPIYRIKTPRGELLLAFSQNVHSGSTITMEYSMAVGAFVQRRPCFVGTTIIEALYIIARYKSDGVKGYLWRNI